ncbi:GATOR complex protein Iml1 isoform X2 [Arctopsyche grandis]|uniref:GATOR complex protein Iml1 isoform X2 n=1 Tax=Arctopsyche grandis TaxID=121162 RepID=UPI00406D6758
MKHVKLHVHTKSFSTDDLIINPKDHPSIKEGDVVEIYQPENEFPRLLLQVPPFKEDGVGRGKDTISIEQSIATTFQLRAYADVYLNVVNHCDVALDSIEVTFKDQYMGRSEMWRLKNHLNNTCVYMNKKIEHCGGTIRCQVYEMWSQGDRVACGVITDETKIVFRSSTSMVYLFIQMSSEMWDFDIHGDLYFEKAVNGFLADLFAKWKKYGCNHEVTIVLFSRTFYKAKTLDEFPQHMRECLQQDYRGRYYEDFYRVAVQNERYEDWSNILLQLRRLFTDYQKIVLQYHERSNIDIPSAVNSTAAQGNFLEVLNMSLNVFEKHYLDRSFDRTGQLSVVITPGVGVFEVDRELTNVTKQRIIDNGVGSDLVCVGEQPLHAVPLLKFHNKDTTISSVDDYSMPHWINLSFYSTNKKVAYSNFIPRIKLPPRRTQEPLIKVYESEQKGKLLKEEEYIHNSLFDYDAYDAHVFQLPPVHGTCLQRVCRTKKTSAAGLEIINRERSPPYIMNKNRKMSDPDIHHNFADILSSSVNKQKGNPDTLYNIRSSALGTEAQAVISPEGVSAAVVRTGRALINPFDPSHVTVKLTSNRRRWTHIFPKGPTGVLIQQHHYQARPMNGGSAADEASIDIPLYSKTPPPQACSVTPPGPLSPTPPLHLSHHTFLSDASSVRKRSLISPSHPAIHSTPPQNIMTFNNVNSTNNNNNIALLWGATGEQEWTPALTTGVDWKSLTIPACLPITTDYFPDKRSLQNDYVVSEYNLLPDDVNADFAQNRAIYKEPLTTVEVFKEIISQRLAQGFQLIVGIGNGATLECEIIPVLPPAVRPPLSACHYLSIGRVFHKLSLAGSTITVTRYRPRHPYPPFNIHYRYRFHAPHHDTYEVSWVSFTTEKLENFNWNYMDHYICTRGDTDFVLVEALKYWRFRTLLLPLNNPATKRILEGAPHCDIYPEPTRQDLDNLTNGFLKMTEMHLNKIKRPISNKQKAGVGNSPFRERVGSTRLPDKPRFRFDTMSAANKDRVRVAITNEIDQHDDFDDGFATEMKLKSTATLIEILEAMKNPVTGVGFMMQTVSLPSNTFVSIDGIQWLIYHVDGITNIEKAKDKMDAMHKEGLICHASGDFSKTFIIGYYMYFMLPQKKDSTDFISPLGDLQSFENEWMEVEVLGPRTPHCNASDEPHPQGALDIGDSHAMENLTDESKVPAFLCNHIDPNYINQDNSEDSDLPLYKNTHLDIDVNSKSDRIEWGHARYQSSWRPYTAYEMCIQWLTASGNIVADLIFGWARKAQGCSLQMVPIPADPLALPFTLKSDPLRGPIYIPLNEEPLLRDKAALFEGFPEETWPHRLFLFQEAIVARFGFIKCTVESTSHMGGGVGEHLYVHVTGNMFILIPTTPPPPKTSRIRSVTKNINPTRYPVHLEIAPSPHEAYITRHVSGKNKDDYDTSRRMGFLWSWNHMVSKKWRSSNNTPATGDENFQIRFLRDFKHFCANQEQRLSLFWEGCWELKEKAEEADV